jgi:hypothetical protein
MALFSKLREMWHVWNAFKDEPKDQRIAAYGEGVSFGSRPDRVRIRLSTERTMLASIFTRISIDAAAMDIRHVRVDENDRYLSDIDSGLNNCLKVEANIDQAPRHFKQDIIMSLFDQGSVAIVPVDTTINPAVSAGFDIQTMRVGKIVQWFPKQVIVEVYDENRGVRRQILSDKKYTAIIENPLYAVMNEPNSTLQRLIYKLNLLDQHDTKAGAGKLDIIIQLPYVVKSEARRQQAEQRRTDIENQLAGSTHGIAYTDGTEKVVQLNRPVENTLLKQIEYLTDLLYSQLGVTPEVMNGTADEKTMNNYYARTIEPLVAGIVEAMKRTFLSKTARSQGQSVMAFRDPFKLVPISDIAEIGDKFIRNTIGTPNDMRQAIGWKPSKDPKADQLANPNMPEPTVTPSESTPPNLRLVQGGNSQNGSS